MEWLGQGPRPGAARADKRAGVRGWVHFPADSFRQRSGRESVRGAFGGWVLSAVMDKKRKRAGPFGLALFG